MNAPPTLTTFLVTGFKGHYPVGTAAVVYAHNREEAKRLLHGELLCQRLGDDNPDDWTLTPLTPPPGKPGAHVLLNGDY